MSKYTNHFDLKLILPNYEELKEHINIFREEAKKINEEIMKNEILINRTNMNKNISINNIEYFNNISILGERGTGKTSILLDLANYLIKDEENINRVFKLITPEIINKEEDLLGWIISLFSDEVKKIIDECECKNRFLDNSFNQAILQQALNELKTAYFLRRETYDSIIINDYSSKIDYVSKKSEKLNADVQLKDKFNILVDNVIRYYRYMNKEPLLIFMFDDVDIFSSRVNEVLNIIMKYFSHSNIVTFIAGEQNSFIENLTIELLKQESLLDSSLLELSLSPEKTNVKEIRKQRAYELLKKVLPPAHRYFIPRLTNFNKYDIIKDNYKDENTNIYNLITELEKDFIKYNDEIIYEYFEFFDDKVRGFINVITYINNNKIFSEINSKQSHECNEHTHIGENRKFYVLKELLNIIIDSSKDFETNKLLINKIFNIPYNYTNNEENINKDGEIKFKGYINYSFIKDEVERIKDEKVISEEKFNQLYKIFILGNFYEMLFVKLGLRSKNKIHGAEELGMLINTINNDGKIIPRIDINDLNQKDQHEEEKEIINPCGCLIYLKQKMFDKLRYDELQQIFKPGYSVYLRATYLYVFQLYNKKIYNGNLKNIFKEIINYDETWVDNQVEWIYNCAFSEKRLLNEICKEIIHRYKEIDSIIDFNSIKLMNKNIKEIIEQFKNRYNHVDLNKINEINNSLDILKYMNSVEEYRGRLDELEELERQSDDLSEAKNKDQNKINELNTKYSDIDGTYNTIKILMENLYEDINNKINLDTWNTNKKDLRIIKGKIQENSNNDLVESNSNSLNYKIINIHLEEIVKNSEFDGLNLELEDYVIYSPTINSLINNEMEIFIKDYYSKVIIYDKLNKHPINQYYALKKHIIGLEKDINRINENLNIRNKEIVKSVEGLGNFNVIAEFATENGELKSSLINDLFIYIINYEIKQLKPIKDKILYLEIVMRNLYNFAINNIYNIDSELFDLLEEYVRSFRNNEHQFEKYTYYKVLKIIQDKKRVISNFDLDALYDFVNNRSGVKNHSRSIVPKRITSDRHVLDIELMLMQLERERSRREGKLYTTKKMVLLSSLTYVIQSYVTIILNDKKDTMGEREIDHYLTDIKNELDKFVKEEKSVSLFKDYLTKLIGENVYVK